MNAYQTIQKTKGDLVVLGGQILFDENDSISTYQLLAGEVVILRSGHVIDVIEAGEVLDAGIWDGATAVAWTDSVLKTIEMQPQMPPIHIHAAVLDRHLALAA